MARSALLLASPLLITACFTTTADYRGDAEKFILENEQLSDSQGVVFTTATCQEPDSQDVGTTFDCTATDDQAQSWEFSIEITGSNEYEVNISRFP